MVVSGFFLEGDSMLVTRAMEFAEHLRELDRLRAATTAVATSDSHRGLSLMQCHLRNHLRIETTAHYQPHDIETGVGPCFVACVTGRVAASKVREARVFAYAYQTAIDESHLH